MLPSRRDRLLRCVYWDRLFDTPNWHTSGTIKSVFLCFTLSQTFCKVMGASFLRRFKDDGLTNRLVQVLLTTDPLKLCGFFLVRLSANPHWVEPFDILLP